MNTEVKAAEEETLSETYRTQKQTRKDSGVPLRFNLDPHSVQKMRDAQKFHEDNKNPISHSVIVRRALRVYFRLLQRLETREAIEAEAIETQRAAKGVL